MDASVMPAALRQSLRSSQPPLLIDLRRNEVHTWNPAADK
jgi:hypothetical protein